MNVALLKLKREEYLEPMRPTQQPVSQVSTTQASTTEEAVETDEERFWSFIEGLDRDLGYKLIIYRLPQYQANGKWGRQSMTSYCGDMPVGVDELVTNDYLNQIQLLYGPGAYRIELRDNNGHYVKRWPVVIDAPSVTHTTHQGLSPAQTALAYQQPSTQGDDFARFLDQAKKFAEVQKVFGGFQQPQAPAQSAPAPEAPIEEKIALALINKAIEKDDGTVLEKVAAKYLGPAKEESGLTEIALKIAEPLVPVLASGLGALINRFLIPQQEQQPAPAAPPAADPQPAQPEQKALPASLSPQQLAWIKLLHRIREDIVDDAPVSAAVHSFDAFALRYPAELHTPHGQLLLNGEPNQFLTSIKVEITSNTVEWVIDFREELEKFGEDQEEEKKEEEEKEE